MSNRKTIVLTAVVTALITAVISCKATSFFKDNIAIYLPSSNADKSFSNKFAAVDNILEKKYLYDFNKENLREEAVRSYVEGLNEPYTHYYSAAEFSSYISNVQDGYVGIGVIVGVNEDNLIEVVAPFEGSPAYEAGIEPGDILKAVNGIDFSGDKLTEAVNMIKGGKEGTTVDLTLVRSGSDEINVTVERRDISSDSVKGEMLDGEIGYVRVTGFNMESENGEHSTSSEFKRTINELQSNGMKKIIIDLRDNPGGVLDEACNMADLFLSDGTITYTEDRNGKRNYYNADKEAVDMPVVILINGNSASASEVFTGALKDYDKAVVVGTKSYGKGIVQEVIPFYDGSGISLTTAKYYTPNGTCIHEIGIEPDFLVKLPDTDENEYTALIEREQDTQLKKAIEVIKEK